MNSQVVIETKDLTKAYGNLVAVDKLNLHISEGEIFGFLGPNGAGKTTTILMLLGLTEPTSGNAQICGYNPNREPLQVKKIVGYLPENQDLYKSLREYGYVLVFKPVMKKDDGTPKGNVDADLVLRAMIDYNKYSKAIIVTSDGDFYCLVRYLYEKNKLLRVLSPTKEKCSVLLMKEAREKVSFMNNLQKKLEYIKIMKKHR